METRLLKLFPLLGALFTWCYLLPDQTSVWSGKPKPLLLAGREWVLPTEVEVAKKEHRLAFKSPNYYYARIGRTGKVHLEFTYDASDDVFLYPKNTDSTKYYKNVAHTYCFTFPDTLNTYDSLRTVIINQITKPLVSCVDTMRFSPAIRKKLFSKGQVHYEIAKVDDDVYIAIRHQPRQAVYYAAKVQVFFFAGIDYDTVRQRLTIF